MVEIAAIEKMRNWYCERYLKQLMSKSAYANMMKNFDTPDHLKLKRGEKEPVYKMDSNALQRYKEKVLEGILNALHNSVLRYTYNRMCNKYGVLVDTYRNEYFADTGKTAKNILQIAHWLEFSNPAIHGLLKSYSHTAMEKNVFNMETEEGIA